MAKAKVFVHRLQIKKKNATLNCLRRLEPSPEPQLRTHTLSLPARRIRQSGGEAANARGLFHVCGGEEEEKRFTHSTASHIRPPLHLFFPPRCLQSFSVSASTRDAFITSHFPLLLSYSQLLHLCSEQGSTLYSPLFIV